MDWSERNRDIASLAKQQLFFVGGAPRSGTTWLQQMLDCHPDMCCRGEGLFLQQLAVPLEKAMVERAGVLDAKNKNLFQHTGGYPLPLAADVEFLMGTAILLALQQQTGGKAYRAVGEKTPENVFLYSRLKGLFPTAKFISIARDPRDVLTSAWHFFRPPMPNGDEVKAKIEFIRGALPSLADGARKMIAYHQENPSSHMMVTYEGLLAAPEPILAGLFRFLGVRDSDDIVADCLKRTAFDVQTGGRAAGVEANGAFHRKGEVGTWRSTLTDQMSDIILAELGWMFSHFGWAR